MSRPAHALATAVTMPGRADHLKPDGSGCGCGRRRAGRGARRRRRLQPGEFARPRARANHRRRAAGMRAISLVLDAASLARLDAMAAAAGESRAAIVARLLAEASPCVPESS